MTLKSRRHAESPRCARLLTNPRLVLVARIFHIVLFRCHTSPGVIRELLNKDGETYDKYIEIRHVSLKFMVSISLRVRVLYCAAVWAVNSEWETLAFSFKLNANTTFGAHTSLFEAYLLVLINLLWMSVA